MNVLCGRSAAPSVRAYRRRRQRRREKRNNNNNDDDDDDANHFLPFAVYRKRKGGGKAFKKGFSFYYVLTRPHARGLFELITRGVVRPCRQCIRVHKRIRSIYKGIFILFRSTRTCFMSFSFFLFLSPCPPHTSPSTPVAALHAN